MKKLALIITICVLISIAAIGCGEQEYSGSFAGNDEQYLADFSILNSTQTHQMNIKEGTKIKVDIENKSGRIDVLVEDSDGEKVYKGDNASSGSFTIETPKTDTYVISITGKKAKGSVHFKIDN